MKKSIFKLGLLLTVSALSFVSCNDDNDDNKKKPKPGALTATIKYELPDRHDLLKYMNMTIYYTNSEGVNVSEVVTTPTWEKSITNVPVPGTYTLKIVYTRNSTPLEQESYLFGRGLRVSFNMSDGTKGSSDSGREQTVSKNKVEDVIATITEDEKVVILE